MRARLWETPREDRPRALGECLGLYAARVLSDDCCPAHCLLGREIRGNDTEFPSNLSAGSFQALRPICDRGARYRKGSGKNPKPH
jgi:hypothetical protein